MIITKIKKIISKVVHVIQNGVKSFKDDISKYLSRGNHLTCVKRFKCKDDYHNIIFRNLTAE